MAKQEVKEEVPGVAAQPASYFYTGKPYDADLGAYTFNYRSYDPEAARWTSADPSGFPDGVNNHIYARNFATSHLDPTGFATVTINGPGDALNYYASNAGGDTNAGQTIINEIKGSEDYASMLSELKNTLSSKLAAVPLSLSNGTLSSSPGANRSLGYAGLTLGGLALNLSYSAAWTAGAWNSGMRLVEANNIAYNFSFSDNWNFDPDSNSVLKNIFDEFIPGLFATAYSYWSTGGNYGKAFTISGSFTDKISANALQYE